MYMNHFLNLLINANFYLFDVQDSYKIPDRIESAAHKLRQPVTSLFCITTRTFESHCILLCLCTSGCHHIHIHSCSTHSMLNGLLLQHNPNCHPNWMAWVLCQDYFDFNIAYFLQEYDTPSITRLLFALCFLVFLNTLYNSLFPIFFDHVCNCIEFFQALARPSTTTFTLCGLVILVSNSWKGVLRHLDETQMYCGNAQLMTPQNKGPDSTYRHVFLVVWR